MKKEEIMIVLDKKFQNKIFQRLIDKYGSSIKTSKILKIPASSIRCYKHFYFKSVPKD